MNELTPTQQSVFGLWFRNKQAEAYLYRKQKARKARREKIWSWVILAAAVSCSAVVVAIIAASAFISTLILSALING